MTSTPRTSSSPRRRARRGEGERLREEILQKTEELLLATADESAVSIRAIADACGCTPPSIYMHFADKDQLILAVCERQFAAFHRISEEAASGATDALDGLYRRGQAYIRFGLEHPEHYRIMFMVPTHVHEKGMDPREILGFGSLVGAIERGIDAGELRRTDPVLLSFTLWAAVHGLTSLLIAQPDFPFPPVEVLWESLFATLRDGLRSEP